MSEIHTNVPCSLMRGLTQVSNTGGDAVVRISSFDYYQKVQAGEITSETKTLYNVYDEGILGDATDISYGDTTVADAIDSLAGTTLIKTLTAGETELIFEDEAIKLDSTIDPYSSVYTAVAEDMVVEVGKITMTFSEQDEDIQVKVVIR